MMKSNFAPLGPLPAAAMYHGIMAMIVGIMHYVHGNRVMGRDKGRGRIGGIHCLFNYSFSSAIIRLGPSLGACH